ncbi:hypothetical protein R1sor_015815 [Riccia sorocarpa]|uniref:Uncharacterized protein n=1 Tax=Riccia sorocarpa TaxID=122646 RepID=A0ABD3HF32_9MARC
MRGITSWIWMESDQRMALVLVDLMHFREQALRVILDLSSTVVTLLVLLVHEEYQQYVLPKIAESKKLAKAGRAKGREADADYNQAKQEFRRNWLRTMMLVSSARSPINIRHLDKATLPGKESIVAEGNMAYTWSRCINAVFAASELVRVERNELLKRLIAQEQRSAGRRSHENLNPVPEVVKGAEGLAAIDTNVKAVMKTFVQCSSAIMLEALSDSNRSPLVAKLVFMDQLCELSRHLPRSTFEQHIPQSILRSIYQLYYENTTPTLVPVASSWRQVARSESPSRGSRRDVSEFGNVGDTTTAAGELARATSRGSIFSGPIKFSSQRKVLDDSPLDGGSGKKPGRFSGPLDYNGIRKVSFAENSSSSSVPGPPPAAVQPQRRYISSRSGPVSYAYD